MSHRIVNRESIKAAYSNGAFQPVLDAKECAELCRIRVKTLYEWVRKGRLDGTWRKRGKQLVFWRDAVVDALMNGAEWKD